MQQCPVKMSVIMIFQWELLLQITETKPVLMSNKTCVRSPSVNQSTPSFAAKGKIALWTLWDRWKLNLQWKKTKRVCYLCEIWKYQPSGSKHCCTVASPVYFDFKHEKSILGRKHCCLIQDHIQQKKHPCNGILFKHSNGLVSKHSKNNLVHENSTLSLNFPHCVPSFSKISFLPFFLSVRISCMLPSLQLPLFAIE